MKTIESLTNAEKARLLHELFPDEITRFLGFVTGMSATIKEDEQAQREKWTDGLFNFDFWLSLTAEADRKIKQYGNKLDSSSRLFADQLFDGYLAMYMVHCLTVYTTQRLHPNRKFALAVELLFS